MGTRPASNGKGLALGERGSSWLRAVLLFSARLGVLVLPIAIWQWAVDRGHLANYVASYPTKIGRRFWEWALDGTLLENSLITLGEALVGYAIGVSLGAALAVVFFLNPRIARIYLPVMTTLNSIPRLAFAPLFIAWLGFGPSSKVALVIAVIVYINFFAIYDGLKEVDGETVEWVRSLGASRGQVWRSVRGPAIVRWILASLRISAGFALGAAVVGEFVGASRGIGFLISRGANLFRGADVFAGIIVVVLVVGVLDLALRQVERRLSHWMV